MASKQRRLKKSIVVSIIILLLSVIIGEGVAIGVLSNKLKKQEANLTAIQEQPLSIPQEPVRREGSILDTRQSQSQTQNESKPKPTKTPIQPTPTPTPEPVPESDQFVTVICTDKKNIEDSQPYSAIAQQRVEFVFSITNNGVKTIQGVEGFLIICDLFGKEIDVIGADFTGHLLSAGESYVVDDLGIDINPYIDREVKIYSTDFKDLKMSYEVASIVFEDGSNIQFETHYY